MKTVKLKYSFKGFKTAEFRKYSKALLQSNLSSPELKKYAYALLKQGDYGSCLVAHYVFRKPGICSKSELKRLVTKYAKSADWAVRETGACFLGTLLADDFDYWFPFAKQMAVSKNVNIRRAAIVGSMNSSLTLKQIERIVRYIYDPCIRDDEVYIRKNLGPFAIGSFLLRKWPEVAFKWMDVWMNSRHGKPRAIWNVLNAFHATRLKDGDKVVKRAERYLAKAEKIDDKIVQSAIKSLKIRLCRQKKQK